MPNAYTLERKVQFNSLPFLGKRSVTMTLGPGQNGIEFVCPQGIIPCDSEHLNTYLRVWGHMLVITNKPVEKVEFKDIAVLVPEHIVSACHYAGITDAQIELLDPVFKEGHIPKGLEKLIFRGNPNRIKNMAAYLMKGRSKENVNKYTAGLSEAETLPWGIRNVLFRGIPPNWNVASTPAMDGSIREFYTGLMANRTPINSKRIPEFEVIKEIRRPGKYGIMAVLPPISPGKLTVSVLGMPNDLYDCHPQEFEVLDVYNEIENHINARTLNRPPRIMYFGNYRDFFQSNLKCNSLTITKGMPVEEKWAKMRPPYHKTGNEQFAHILSDLGGEIQGVFGGRLYAHIILYDGGGGHSNRVFWFKYMPGHGYVRRVA